jgi:hypothetical protein
MGACLVLSTSCPRGQNPPFCPNIFWPRCKNSENTAIALFFKAQGAQVLRAMTRIFPADSGLFIAPSIVSEVLASLRILVLSMPGVRAVFGCFV